MDLNKYFQILGLSHDANLEDVKLAYRKLAKKFHPDLNNGDVFFNDHFLKIQEAYNILAEYLSLNSSSRVEEDVQVSILYFPTTLSFGDRYEVVININRKVENVFISEDNQLFKVSNCNIKDINIENCQITILNTVISYRIQFIPQFHLLLSNGQYIVTESKNINLLQYKNFTGNNSSNKKESLSSGLKYTLIIFFIILFLFPYFGLKHEVKNHSKIINQTNSDIKYEEEEAIIEVNSDYNQLNNGDSPYDEYFGKGVYDKTQQSKLIIRNGDDYDAVICLVREDNSIIRNEYIRLGEVFTMTSIPNGVYYLKIFYGNNWNPNINLFGKVYGGFDRDQRYSIMNKNDTQIIMQEEIKNSEIYYHNYEITLYTVPNGNVKSKEIDLEDFFEK